MHERRENPSCETLPAESFSKRFKDQWPNVKTIFAINRYREEKDKRFFPQKTDAEGKQYYEKNTGEVKKSEEKTYYVSSLDLSPAEALTEVRKHWQIENKLHWVLDVAFHEDNCMVRAKILAKNLSLMRKIALNLIRSSNTKGSVRGRMKKAAWSNDFMELLLRNSV